MSAPQEASPHKPQSKVRWRLVIALAVVGLLPLAVKASGLGEQLSVTHLRDMVAQAGAWGALAFVGLFVGAVMAQVPGIPFVLLAPTLFELPEAWLLCFFASNLSVVLNFALVRKLGGQPFSELESPRLKRLLAQLDRHPVRTVAVLRTLTVMFPAVTGALALTGLSARDHAIGSALGMLLPVTAILMATGALVHLLP